MAFFKKAIERHKKEQEISAIVQDIEQSSDKEPFSEEDQEKAQMMAENPEIMGEILQDIKTMGLVGEDNNALMTYLSMTSRKMDNPLNIVIKGEPSTGKNALISCTSVLFPEGEVKNISRMTPHALEYYGKGALKHKTLIIQEDEGSQDANYSLRIIQSEKKLVTSSVAKNEKTGKMETVEITVEGPVNTITTTNRARLKEDNETRMLTLYVDTSEKQTRKVVTAIKESYSRLQDFEEGRICSIRCKHKAFQENLTKYEVTIPYFKHINFPTDKNRARRDITALGTLIKTVAFIRQFQKPHKISERGILFLEADFNDYKIAHEIFSEIMARTLSDIDHNARKFLKKLNKWWKEALKDLNKDETGKFTFDHKMIQQELRISESNVRKYMNELRETPYIVVVQEGKKGRNMSWQYRLPDLDKNDIAIPDIGITTPAELAEILENK